MRAARHLRVALAVPRSACGAAYGARRMRARRGVARARQDNDQVDGLRARCAMARDAHIYNSARARWRILRLRTMRANAYGIPRWRRCM